MALVDSRGYVLGGIYYSVLMRNIMWLVNTPSKHDVDPALVQRLLFAGLRSIAAGLVLLTAGGDYKPTPIQCLLNVGPASSVLASIHSVPILVSTS